MAWRKVHLGEEVWEWQVSRHSASLSGAPNVVIRSPMKVVTTVPWDVWETVRDKDGRWPIKVLVFPTPGSVKAYIERNRAHLMAKPEARRKREEGRRRR